MDADASPTARHTQRTHAGACVRTRTVHTRTTSRAGARPCAHPTLPPAPPFTPPCPTCSTMTASSTEPNSTKASKALKSRSSGWPMVHASSTQKGTTIMLTCVELPERGEGRGGGGEGGRGEEAAGGGWWWWWWRLGWWGMGGGGACAANRFFSQGVCLCVCATTAALQPECTCCACPVGPLLTQCHAQRDPHPVLAGKGLQLYSTMQHVPAS